MKESYESSRLVSTRSDLAAELSQLLAGGAKQKNLRFVAVSDDGSGGSRWRWVGTERRKCGGSNGTSAAQLGGVVAMVEE
ncbi:hypothetical protein L3X38_036137 [Prunus dulcis]|uniref:Uncharacterized protein n=1 Tax=Prunus dulcis TaxID=3755 RepID=A0AAD4V0U6_PRUDU|nr:hypothetical protein L3X38_036137 [Prunus dulcis]